MRRGSLRPERETGRFGGLLCLPPLLLAGAATAGIGLARAQPAWLALAAGACLALLPALGLAALLGVAGRRPLVRVLACWIWSGLLLLALPAYFPGERAAATARGLYRIGSPLGESAARGLARLGGQFVAMLGDEGERAATPPPDDLDTFVRSERDETAAGVLLDPRAGASRAAPESSLDPPRVAVLPYEGDEHSVRVSVEFAGANGVLPFAMIFDTGATYTTLSPEALRALDVEIEPNAPRVELRTANGPIEASLVLLDAVWLGAVAVEWVTAAVCEPCAGQRTAGLLGLNVSREFLISLDHDRKRIELRERERLSNRRLDIASWLTIHSTATRHSDARVDVELRASNRARRAVENAVIALDCGGNGFAIEIGTIPAHAEASTQVALPAGTDCRHQKLELSRARWQLDSP